MNIYAGLAGTIHFGGFTMNISEKENQSVLVRCTDLVKFDTFSQKRQLITLKKKARQFRQNMRFSIKLLL